MVYLYVNNVKSYIDYLRYYKVDAKLLHYPMQHKQVIKIDSEYFTLYNDKNYFTLYISNIYDELVFMNINKEDLINIKNATL